MKDLFKKWLSKKSDQEKYHQIQKEIKELESTEISPMEHNCEDHHSLSNMNRRDLLGQGFVAGSGMLMLPGLLGTISQRAYAQEVCQSASLNAKIPFMSIDLSGGAAISGGNVMVGGPGGQTDMLSEAGYTRLGFAPGTQNQINTELGIAFHADSAFLRGIKSKASAEALAKVNGAIACARLANDTQNNTQSPLAGIIKAGATGALFPSIGTKDSTSGAKSMPVPSMFAADLRPTVVSNDRALTGTIDTGKLVADLNQDSALAIMRRISSLSESKKLKLTDAALKKEIAHCGYKGATDTIQNFADPNALNVRGDSVLSDIFSNNDLGNGKLNRAATHAKALVNGFAGAGVIELGGYDYHNGTRATGEQRDFEAGQAMGGAIEYAHRKGRQLIVYVFSDGSVRSDGQIDDSAGGRGKGVWRGDSGTTSAAFMLVYNPAARPEMTPVGHQLGHYLPDGNVNRMANIVADSASNLGYWVVLNYMALNGDVGQFAQLFPNNPFGSTVAELSPYIQFAPIA